jgi:PAS domain S-box-containing protein
MPFDESTTADRIGALVAMLDACPMPCWACDSATGRIFAANRAASRKLGWSHEALLQHCMAHLWAQPSAAEREMLCALSEGRLASWRQRTEDGSPLVVHAAISRIEAGHRPAYLMFATQVSEVASAALEAEPRRLSAVLNHTPDGVSLIVTARREAEEARLRSETSFRALIEQLPIGVFVNRAGKLAYVNPALLSMLGHDAAADLLGRSPFDIIAPSLHQVVRARVADLEAAPMGTRNPPAEREFVRADGSSMRVEVEALKLTFDGEPAIVVVVRDLREHHEVRVSTSVRLQRGSSSRCPTPDAESRRKRSPASSIHSSRPSPSASARGWACPSRAASSSPWAARSGSRARSDAAACSASCSRSSTGLRP